MLLINLLAWFISESETHSRRWRLGMMGLLQLPEAVGARGPNPPILVRLIGTSVTHDTKAVAEIFLAM